MKVGVALPYVPSLTHTRVADYLQLARPRLALLVLATAGGGWILAAEGTTHTSSSVHALVGTALLFAGASAFNQLLERHRDALMPRTANRPLPAGRLQTGEVLALGSILSAGGLVYLLAFCQPLAGGAGGLRLFQLRPRVHAAERAHAAQHFGRRRTRRRAAADWLGRGPREPGTWGLGVILNRLSLADSSFLGHRLDLPRPVCPRRLPCASGPGSARRGKRASR